MTKAIKNYIDKLEKYNLEYKIENLENKIEHHQEVINTLQKKNAELKKESNQLFLEGAKRVEALEKENAELKKWKEDTIKARGNDYMAWSRQNDQLTKVKVALRKVIDYLGQFCSDYPDCVIEAENFLKESDIDSAIQQANKGLDFDKIADEMEQDLKDSEVEK